MEEKNISENELNDKKSWLEEQLQKRNLISSEETFSFKDDRNTEENTKVNNAASSEIIETTITQEKNTQTLNNNENIFISDDIKNEEKQIVLSAEKSSNGVVEENKELHTERPKNEETPFVQNKAETQKEIVQNEIKILKPVAHSKWFQKLSQIGQKKLWGQITVKKAVPYAFGSIILLFLVFNIRYVIFSENKVPSLHNVNVKDTLLSDMSVTKVLDPSNPDKNDVKKKSNKQQKSDQNDNIAKDKTEKITERIYYKVKSGDKFNDIARKHGLTPAELKELNPKVRPERIQPGQKLRVKKLD